MSMYSQTAVCAGSISCEVQSLFAQVMQRWAVQILPVIFIKRDTKTWQIILDKLNMQTANSKPQTAAAIASISSD